MNYAQEVTDSIKDYTITKDTDIHDLAHEIADSLVPIYHSDILKAAAEDMDLATDEPEIGPAFDGKPTPINIIAANIYERYYQEAMAQLEAIVNK